MKRSNRLVLLIGVFLAIVAFVAVIVMFSGNGRRRPRCDTPTTGPVVVATTDIPLSTKVQSDQVTTKTVDLTAILPGAYTDTSQVVGKVVRQTIAADAQVTSASFAEGGSVIDIEVPEGLRAISVQVDQVSGVGTLIKTGDYVDMVVGFASDKFPVVTQNPVDDSLPGRRWPQRHQRQAAPLRDAGPWHPAAAPDHGHVRPAGPQRWHRPRT